MATAPRSAVVGALDEPPFLPAPESSGTPHELTRGQRMVSACTGALLTSLLVTPFDVIKTRMQAQSPVPKSVAAATEAAASAPTSSSNGSKPSLGAHAHHNHAHGHLHHHAPAAPFGADVRAGLMHGAASSVGGGGAHSHAHVLSTGDLLRRCTHYQYSNGLMDVWCLKCDLPRPVSSIRFEGPIDTAVKIIRHEGPANLWRGLAPTLVMSVPSTIVYFSTYDELKTQVELRTGIAGTLSPLVAGTTARAFTTTLVSPLELIRTKLQAEKHSQPHVHNADGSISPLPNANASASSSSSASAAASSSSSSRGRMWRVIQSEISKTRGGANGGSGGIRNLWRGVAPTLWRDVPFSAIYWTSYENLKVLYLNALTRPSSSAAVRAATAATTSKPKAGDLAWAAFLSGASAGMFAAAMTHPFDVVKTRRQIEMYNFEIEGEAAAAAAKQNGDSQAAAEAAAAAKRKAVSGTGAILRTIWAEEGTRGLYTGLIARMAKVAPACAIMISTYEFAKAYFAAQRDNANGNGNGKPRTNPSSTSTAATATAPAK